MTIWTRGKFSRASACQQSQIEQKLWLYFVLVSKEELVGMHAISVLNAALVRHLFTKAFINNYHMETTKQSNKNLSIKNMNIFCPLKIWLSKFIGGSREKKKGGVLNHLHLGSCADPLFWTKKNVTIKAFLCKYCHCCWYHSKLQKQEAHGHNAHLRKQFKSLNTYDYQNAD